jgi:Zn-finger protein
MMKGILLCSECAYYSKKSHRCVRGAHIESNPADPFFDDCPLPDVAPAKPGRWIKSIFGGDFWVCSECSAVWNRKFEFCPHCAAIMDGESEES